MPATAHQTEVYRPYLYRRLGGGKSLVAGAGAAPGTSILEASSSFIDNREAPEAHSFPEVLLRRGVGERIEARFGIGWRR